MFQNSPLVSIIIPNYNRALLIPETLSSILNQAYTNWEAIVVDDGSTDESAKIIEEFASRDNRIKFFPRDKTPKGAPTCRNIGFERSKGSFIIYLDSDDLLAPYCLSTRLSFFKENPALHFMVFPMLVFHEKPGDSPVLWNISNDEDDLKRFLVGDPPWAVTCPIWKREVIEKIGGWDEGALSWQDWEFHIKAIVLGLAYKNVNTLPDCFVRRDANERISKGDVSALQLRSKFNLFLTIYGLLQRNNKLSEINKRSFANLMFKHAEKCAVFCAEEPLAENCSSKIIELGLVPRPVGALLAVYIKSLITIKNLKLRYFSTFSFHLFRLLLPHYLTRSSSKHFSMHMKMEDLERLKKLV